MATSLVNRAFRKSFLSFIHFCEHEILFFLPHPHYYLSFVFGRIFILEKWLLVIWSFSPDNETRSLRPSCVIPIYNKKTRRTDEEYRGLHHYNHKMLQRRPLYPTPQSALSVIVDYFTTTHTHVLPSYPSSKPWLLLLCTRCQAEGVNEGTCLMDYIEKTRVGGGCRVRKYRDTPKMSGRLVGKGGRLIDTLLVSVWMSECSQEDIPHPSSKSTHLPFTIIANINTIVITNNLCMQTCSCVCVYVRVLALVVSNPALVTLRPSIPHSPGESDSSLAETNECLPLPACRSSSTTPAALGVLAMHSTRHPGSFVAGARHHFPAVC